LGTIWEGAVAGRTGLGNLRRRSGERSRRPPRITSTEGKTYIGPGPYLGIEDREVVSFDGKVLILKWVNPEVAGRYGIMVLARCGSSPTSPARTP